MHLDEVLQDLPIRTLLLHDKRPLISHDVFGNHTKRFGFHRIH